jgi:hypothetical protein
MASISPSLYAPGQGSLSCGEGAKQMRAMLVTARSSGSASGQEWSRINGHGATGQLSCTAACNSTTCILYCIYNMVRTEDSV